MSSGTAHDEVKTHRGGRESGVDKLWTTSCSLDKNFRCQSSLLKFMKLSSSIQQNKKLGNNLTWASHEQWAEAKDFTADKTDFTTTFSIKTAAEAYGYCSV